MRKIKSILCVVEPDKNSEAALFQTIRIAGDLQADVAFASVIESPKNLGTVFKQRKEIERGIAEAARQKQSTVETWIKNRTQRKDPEVKIYSGIGFIEIVKDVIRHEYDLVIKCANDVAWLHRLYGSDDMHLLRKCPCPVLILKSSQTELFGNVLATVDINEDTIEQENSVQNKLNEKVLEYGAIFSLPELTSFHIGSAWEPFGEDFLRYGAFSRLPEEKIDDYVAEERDASAARLETLINKMSLSVGKDVLNYLHPKVHMVKGLASKEIPEMVNKHDIDLIVMGTVARTGIPGYIIGNTAESILEQVQCSVLAIKPDGFKSPVTD